MLLKMTSTIGIVIIICALYYVRGVVRWGAISLWKNHTQHLLILFYFKKLEGKIIQTIRLLLLILSTLFFVRFLLSLAFCELPAHYLGSLNTWWQIVQQYLQTMQWWKSLTAEPYNITHATSQKLQNLTLRNYTLLKLAWDVASSYIKSTNIHSTPFAKQPVHPALRKHK